MTAHIDGNENPVDSLPRSLWGGRRRYLVNSILHDVYNGKFMPDAVYKEVQYSSDH